MNATSIDNTSLRRSFVLTAIFLAVLLRLMLATLNSSANDNHLAVGQYIAIHNSFPSTNEVRQAYQPMLYHAVLGAQIIAIINQPYHVHVRLAQLVNVAAGMVTLYVAWAFINKTQLSDKTKLISFSLVALNPRLIGTNVQITNDSFVIMFGTLALFFGYQFLIRTSIRDYVFMVICAVLASASKANGLVIAIAIVLSMMIGIIKKVNIKRGTYLKLTLVFIVLFMQTAFITGSYWRNLQNHGSIFWVPYPTSVWPSWSQETKVGRAGIVSVKKAIFSFPIFSLLSKPYIDFLPNYDYEQKSYPDHQTSIWTTFLGRASILQFEGPPSWVTAMDRRSSREVLMGRLLIIISLVPLMILFTGFLRKIISLFLNLFVQQRPNSVFLGDLLLMSALTGYIMFVVFFSFRYRDFSSMKVIYIYPAIIGIAYVFAGELEKYYKVLSKHLGKRLVLLFDGVWMATIILYVANVFMLLGQLK